MLTTVDFVRLAATATVSPATAARCYSGRRCMPTTIERIRRAAVELGLPAPPPSASGGAAASAVGEAALESVGSE